MKVKLICARLNTRHVQVNGIIDRRFKTGYRVLPQGWLGYELSLTVSNPDGYFRKSEFIITQYGKFIVIASNAVDQTIDLRQLMTIERGDSFVFTPEIEILSAGWSVGEG